MMMATYLAENFLVGVEVQSGFGVVAFNDLMRGLFAVLVRKQPMFGLLDSAVREVEGGSGGLGEGWC